jgi:radical SAM protein with 4Fe4S-binding SPASM domain
MVEIYTNATLLTSSKIERIKDLGLHIAVSLYSSDPKVHDSITRTPGSHAKTMESIRLLREFDIPTRVEMVIMKDNQHTVENTIALREHLGTNGSTPDPLRPEGRGESKHLQPDFEQLVRYGLILKPNFQVTEDMLAHYSTGNPCLLGKIAITEFGDVIPCIFSRDTSVGNALNQNLSAVLKSPKLTKIWRSTKDNVLVCKDCEYRYVCFDCRPLSEGASEGKSGFLNAPYPRCTYNPYTGEWAQGLWKVDQLGQPYYDREHAHEIQKVTDSKPELTNTPISH